MIGVDSFLPIPISARLMKQGLRNKERAAGCIGENVTFGPKVNAMSFTKKLGLAALGSNPRAKLSFSRRMGVSLLELMLVVALLSVIAAISFPAMRRNLGRADVTAAARQLQQQLQRARLDAMESDEPFLFLPQVDSNLFFLGELSIFQQPDFDLDLASTHLSDKIDDQIDPSTGFYQLPESMRFVTAKQSTLNDETPFTESSSFAPSSPLDSLATTDFQSSNSEDIFADAVLFQPNGRIQSATIAIASDDGYRIAVEIEGLAGRIRVGSIFRENLENFENSGERENLSSVEGVIE